MAKKKKSKNILKSYGGFAVLVLTVATFTMLFLTNVKYDFIAGITEVNGLSAVFTWKLTDIDMVLSGFNILALLAYVLPISALVLSLLFGKGKFINIIVLACFVISAVFFFIIPATMPLTEIGKSTVALADAKLGIGAILGGTFSVLSAVVTLLKILVK